MAERYVILGGARTPFAEWAGGKTGTGERGGKLESVSAIDLGAIAARGALERTGVPADKIDHVVMGNALQTSADALYGARHVGLKAGVPLEVPALTVNRQCGSAIQSVVDGTHIIRDGASYVLCGGMENMSQSPHVIRGSRTGLRLGHGQLEDSLLAALRDSYCDMLMAKGLRCGACSVVRRPSMPAVSRRRSSPLRSRAAKDLSSWTPMITFSGGRR